MTIELPFLLTVRETSELLRIQRAKVYVLIQSGILLGAKIGGDWRVRRDSVEALIGPLPREFGVKPGAKGRVVVPDLPRRYR